MVEIDSAPPQVAWRKARRSFGNGECVEVASINGYVAVRDSQNPDDLALRYSSQAWRSFLQRNKKEDTYNL